MRENIELSPMQVSPVKHKVNRGNHEIAVKKGLKTITQQMLSRQLKELEGDGIINRKVIRIMPPKVEYSLTEFGLSVMPILRSFSEWNKRNTRTISVKLNKNFEENRIR